MEDFGVLSQLLESSWIVFILIILGAVGIAFSSGGKGRRKRKFKYDPNDKWPFVKKEILTNAEKEAFEKLRNALPDHYIFSQVQLSQIMKVKPGHDFQKWFNRINRMSVDFLVLDKELKIVSAIEIDDATHRDPKRMEADDKKSKALKAAEINLVRWPARKIPKPEAVQKKILGDDQKKVKEFLKT